MDALSFSRSSSCTVADVSMLMDTSQDFESPSGDVVKWVASQTTNPALQALMKEAERDKRTRPSTPVDEPMSWTYPLSSTTSSTSLTTSVSSVWHSSSHSVVDSLPLSSSSSSASSSLAPRVLGASTTSRHSKPLSAVQRNPLASSTSSVNHLLRDSPRPRSSSHSNPSTSKEKYTPRDDEPEALFFIELLKDASKQVDSNSDVKERVARAKEQKKKRKQSPGRSDIGNPSRLDTNHLSARPLTKTTSASAVYPVRSSTWAQEKALSTSVAAFKHDPRGPASAESSGGSGAIHPSGLGKSTPPLLPRPNPHNNPPRLPIRTSNASNANRPTTPKADLPKFMSNDGDSAMQDIIDLTETDTEWEQPVSGQILCANTTMHMELDDETDETDDTGKDTSFFKPDPPPQTRTVQPRLKPQPTLARPPSPTQRTRTGPPPLGMRRAPQYQPSQYGSTQVPKSMTVPRFKPPLLANGGTNKNGSGTKKPATTVSSRPPARGVQVSTSKVAVATTQDPDSSFDVSFDMDADALEEAMKAYD